MIQMSHLQTHLLQHLHLPQQLLQDLLDLDLDLLLMDPTDLENLVGLESPVDLQEAHLHPQSQQSHLHLHSRYTCLVTRMTLSGTCPVTNMILAGTCLVTRMIFDNIFNI